MLIRTVAESKTQPRVTFVETRTGAINDQFLVREREKSFDILSPTVFSIQ